MKWTIPDLAGLDRFFRANLINSVTGYKSLSLLGTSDAAGQANLAVFTQVMHLGADPALLGILFRPRVPGMHSLENIRQNGWLTLNHVLWEEARQAHWTSARWEESEFEATGLQAEYLPDVPVPFVRGSRIRMALQAEEEIPLKQNGTILLVASLQFLEVPDACLGKDGFANLATAGSLAGTGLDGYAEGGRLQRFSYARQGEEPALLT